MSPKIAQIPDPTFDPFRTLILANADAIRDRLRRVVEMRRAKMTTVQGKMLAMLGRAPDLFEPMGLGASEVHHTRVLRWALDPSAHASLGRAPLDAFFALVHRKGAGKRIAVNRLARSTVRQVCAEFSLPQGRRVDLALEFADGWLLIENKIESGEGQDQLKSYSKWLSSQPTGGVLVYLTREDAETPNVKLSCIHITWRQVLTVLLPIAASGDSDEHQYLGRYLASVARHVVGLTGSGVFEGWTLGERHNTLNLIIEAT